MSSVEKRHVFLDASDEAVVDWLAKDRDSSIRGRCTMCEKPGVEFCGKCNTASYCSRECQINDWAQHKHLCSTFRNFTAQNRPSPNHFRVILFPADDPHPKFEWVEQTLVGNEIAIMTYQYFRESTKRVHAKPINTILERAGFPDIGHGLVMITESANPVKDLDDNKSIMGLGEPGKMAAWMGNAMVAAVEMLNIDKQDSVVSEAENASVDSSGSESCALCLADANFRDMRHAIDSLQVWHLNYGIVNSSRYRNVSIPALLIHSDGSYFRFVRSGLRERIIKVRIPLHIDDTSQKDTEQEFALAPHQVGLEWFIRRLPAAMEWPLEHLNAATLRNEDARHLTPMNGLYHTRRNIRIGVDQESEDIGIPHTGSVALFDITGAPIEPAHLQALNDFMDRIDKFQPRPYEYDEDAEELDRTLWIGAQDCGRGNSSKAEAAFKKFWLQWKKKKQSEGTDMNGIPSPYDIQGDSSRATVMIETIANRIMRGAIYAASD